MEALAQQLSQKSGRFEFKYRITPLQYYAIRNAIAPYMRHDTYTAKRPERRYLVRSLYYETDSFHIYAEKMAGDHGRVKYRLRSYSDTRRVDLSVRVEMKVRRGESLSKYQCFVPFEEYEHFIRHKQWMNPHVDPVLEEFARGVHLMALQPSVLVDYYREAFASRMDDGLRLTFDHQVRSAQADQLYPQPAPFSRVHHSGEVVLEVKYRLKPPSWLKHIIHGYGLRLVANSKFTQGIEAGRRDRHYPNGVLVVR